MSIIGKGYFINSDSAVIHIVAPTGSTIYADHYNTISGNVDKTLESTVGVPRMDRSWVSDYSFKIPPSFYGRWKIRAFDMNNIRITWERDKYQEEHDELEFLYINKKTEYLTSCYCYAPILEYDDLQYISSVSQSSSDYFISNYRYGPYSNVVIDAILAPIYFLPASANILYLRPSSGSSVSSIDCSHVNNTDEYSYRLRVGSLSSDALVVYQQKIYLSYKVPRIQPTVGAKLIFDTNNTFFAFCEAGSEIYDSYRATPTSIYTIDRSRLISVLGFCNENWVKVKLILSNSIIYGYMPLDQLTIESPNASFDSVAIASNSYNFYISDSLVYGVRIWIDDIQKSQLYMPCRELSGSLRYGLYDTTNEFFIPMAAADSLARNTKELFFEFSPGIISE